MNATELQKKLNWGSVITDTSIGQPLAIFDLSVELKVTLYNHQPGAYHAQLIWPGHVATVYHGDDLAQVRATTKWAKRLIDSIIADIKALWARKVMPHCIHEFSDLHAFCDANVLGECEAWLARCGTKWDWTPLINGVQGVIDTWLFENGQGELPVDADPDMMAKCLSASDTNLHREIARRLKSRDSEGLRDFVQCLDDGGWGYIRLHNLLQVMQVNP